MQFSTLVSLALTASARADNDVDSEAGTITYTNYVTKVVSQHTTYVPMAVLFQSAILNTTNGTYDSGNVTTSTVPTASSISTSTSNSTSATAESSDVHANSASLSSVAGLSVIVAAAALIM